VKKIMHDELAAATAGCNPKCSISGTVMTVYHETGETHC
jgi:hypothetical protein